MVEPEYVIDVVVIGGGQAGLAAGHALRRTGLRFVILDAEAGPGGAWRHTWQSLTLFSPARWSSLPGWVMPGGAERFPSRNQVLDYLAAYETRYALPIQRPAWVRAVRRSGERLAVDSERGAWLARAVISATGTWREPLIPDVPGRCEFAGEQLHSADYDTPLPFAGRRVLVVGGGNSGAQIFAELSLAADAAWVTRREPTFLPDDVDGRVLFERATRRYLAHLEGRAPDPADTVGSLGDIVMLPPVREARERGVLHAVRLFTHFTRRGVVWPDGREEEIDAVIWCTGFRPALRHLVPLGIVDACGRIAVDGTRSVAEPRLWLLGYGEWTGYASATLAGVGRAARAIVDVLRAELTSS